MNGSVRRVGWPVLSILFAVPVALAAQQPGTCAVQLDSVGGEGRHVEVAPGIVHQFASGGVWASCRGQATQMRADSMAWYSERNRADFVGRVRFQDSTVTLDAQRASYFPREERLDADGAVRLVNRKTRSELRGPTLSYWRAVPGVRDTAELLARDRPTVEYRAGGDTTNDPYVIVGQQVRLRGDDRAWTGGNVTMERSDFSAQADSAAMDLAAGGGAFVGHAAVHGRGANPYTLTGRVITFRLAQRKLTWVRAGGGADATSLDWRLTADTIAFDIAHEQIQRGVAWGDTLIPRALSSRYTMRADSLLLDTPEQQLREIRGYGRALATSARDSLDGAPDWVAGDSVIAAFDTTSSGQRLLQSLDATGAARAYYRVYEEDGHTLAGINYSRGKRILASFDERGVDRVRVQGAGDGVYLEPVTKRP